MMTSGNRYSLFLCLCLCLGLLLVAPLPAQPWSHSRRPASARSSGAPSLSHQKMEALMVWRLTDELSLSEDQSAQFFPKWRRLRELRNEERSARRALMDNLSALLANPATSQADLKAMVDSVEALEDNYHTTEAQLRSDLFSVLNVEQQARLILFQRSFDQQARQMIKQMRTGRSTGTAR